MDRSARLAEGLPQALPPGLTTRPLTRADAPAVHQLVAAEEQEDLGRVLIDEADIVSDWARPSYDLATRTLGVLDGERLVAYAELPLPDRGYAAVHPAHRGRGIGTALAGELRRMAREQGAAEVGGPVVVGSPGDRLLESLGYHERWRSWALELPPGAEVPARPLPEGHRLQVATPEQYVEVWNVVEDAFLEWSVRERQSYDDFAATVLERPGFEPWQVRVAVDPTGEVAGVAVVALAGDTADITRLAVRAADRRRGLAQALLVDAFGAAREHGATRSTLGTDSRTGALGLYERVGMVVSDCWVNRAIAL